MVVTSFLGTKKKAFSPPITEKTRIDGNLWDVAADGTTDAEMRLSNNDRL